MSSSIKAVMVLLAVALLCHCSDNPTKLTKPNRAPVLASVSPQSVQEGFRLEFVVVATDPDSAVPVLSATNLPTNSFAVDSGNGTLLFVFEPDLTQSGTYYVTFIASDGRLTDSLVATITVTPNRLAHTWPMAIGNCWVYEYRYPDRTSEWTVDSIYVLSSFESDNVTHWRLSSGLRFVGSDIAIRNDSIIGTSQSILMPSVWPDRTDTVPAGIFSPVYAQSKWVFMGPSDLLVLAKDVGVIRYEWFNGSAHYPDGYEARLLRYKVK
jgi:hypothetical protein